MASFGLKSAGEMPLVKLTLAMPRVSTTDLRCAMSAASHEADCDVSVAMSNANQMKQFRAVSDG